MIRLVRNNYRIIKRLLNKSLIKIGKFNSKFVYKSPSKVTIRTTGKSITIYLKIIDDVKNSDYGPALIFNDEKK